MQVLRQHFGKEILGIIQIQFYRKIQVNISHLSFWVPLMVSLFWPLFVLPISPGKSIPAPSLVFPAFLFEVSNLILNRFQNY